MRGLAFLLFLAGSAFSQLPRYTSSDPSLAPVIELGLKRLSEESTVFAAKAPQIVGVEKMEQQSLSGISRFHPRGSAPEPVVDHREIISEYGFSSFRNAPGAIREFRQVVSVDGKRITSPDTARESLAAGMRSQSDKVKKKMLEGFQKYGLLDAATDFGQILLLFAPAQINGYEFQFRSRQLVGADPVLILGFIQETGPDRFTVFQERRAIHQKLQGEVWIRENDGLPIRISLLILRKDGSAERRHTGVVDYMQSPLGLLLPAAVLYQEHINGRMLAETRYGYSNYQMFSAETSVRFETDPQ